LQWKPFNSFNVFKAHILEPIKQNPEKAYKKLQGILQGVLLRRTKNSTIDGKPILDIPKCNQSLHRIDFGHQERQFYNTLKAQSESLLQNLQGQGGCAPSASCRHVAEHALAHLEREVCVHRAGRWAERTLFGAMSCSCASKEPS
jgi:SNF2 family DNA or RNA helicase